SKNIAARRNFDFLVTARETSELLIAAKNFAFFVPRRKLKFLMPTKNYPRTRTALKLSTTWPPAVGRPKLIMGLKREKSRIWSSWWRSSTLVGPERIWQSVTRPCESTVTSTSRPCGNESSRSCCSGAQDCGYSDSETSSVGRIRLRDTS